MVPASATEQDKNDTAGQILQELLIRKAGTAKQASVQNWIDGELAAGAGSTSEWFLISLLQFGTEYDYSTYITALQAFLEGTPVLSATSCQRISLVLVGCGYPEDPFVLSAMKETVGTQGIMSLIFGLHLLNNGCKGCPFTVKEVAEQILSQQLKDGGWALFGTVSDIDVTAMTLQALAPIYIQDQGELTEAVKVAVDRAVLFLSEQQMESGGYYGFGAENPESTAQVMIAVNALGIDPLCDPGFIKAGNTLLDGIKKFRLEDGGFCHTEGGEYSHAATSQVMCALVAEERNLSGQGALYLFTPGETQGTGDPDVPKITGSEGKDIKSGENALTEDTGNREDAESGEGALTEENKQNRTIWNRKLWICGGVVVLAVIVCILLWVCRKRHRFNFLLVLGLVVMAVCAVLLTDIQSAEDYYREEQETTESVGTVTLSIRCDTLMEFGSSDYIPEEGIILSATEFSFGENESVYDILVRAVKKYGIQMETKGAGVGLCYVVGIAYLYEYDYGELSGWIYHVNGVSASVGCADYLPKDGDVIEWMYTRELGKDLE